MRIEIGKGQDSAGLLKRITGFGLVAVLMTLSVTILIPTIPGVHYIQYRAAADLLMSGRSPYEPAEQFQLQQMYLGQTNSKLFLPYYYPPWFALACAPLSLLPYPVACVIYLFLTCLCLVLAGSLLHRVASGLSRWAAIMVVVGFFPSLGAAQTSQTSPLILLLASVLWLSLDRGWDRWAGIALAWLTIKPQLSLVLILGVLLWAARHRRWGVVRAFAAALGLLCLACTVLDPTWPFEMLRATGRVPLPTRSHPEIGVTWPLVLRAAGLRGWRLSVTYAALAFPALAFVVRAAWGQGRPVGEVIGLGSVAAFAIAPYAQFYDFPILLVPLFVVLGNQPPSGSMIGLLLAFVVLPYLNMLAILVAGWPPGTFAWVPVALAVWWMVTTRTSYKK